MPTWAKILIGVLLCIILLVAAVVGIGAYWWSHHSGEYLEAGKKAMTEGKSFGQGTDNHGCVAEALARHKRNSGFTGSISTGIFLRGCLDASRPTPGFCDRVPRTTEFIKSAQWRVAQCSQAGLSDSYCQQLFGQVQQFCESDRASPR